MIREAGHVLRICVQVVRNFLPISLELLFGVGAQVDHRPDLLPIGSLLRIRQLPKHLIVVIVEFGLSLSDYRLQTFQGITAPDVYTFVAEGVFLCRSSVETDIPLA